VISNPIVSVVHWNVPWVYIVVSSATTGFFECIASRTSSETRKKPLLVR
jgi:hypothetical protein